jgi:hypothetical protein
VRLIAAWGLVPGVRVCRGAPARSAIHARGGLDEEPGVYERLEYCSAREWLHVPEAAGLGLRQAQARPIVKFAAHMFSERSDAWKRYPCWLRRITASHVTPHTGEIVILDRVDRWPQLRLAVRAVGHASSGRTGGRNIAGHRVGHHEPPDARTETWADSIGLDAKRLARFWSSSKRAGGCAA